MIIAFYMKKELKRRSVCASQVHIVTSNKRKIRCDTKEAQIQSG